MRNDYYCCAHCKWSWIANIMNTTWKFASNRSAVFAIVHLISEKNKVILWLTKESLTSCIWSTNVSGSSIHKPNKHFQPSQIKRTSIKRTHLLSFRRFAMLDEFFPVRFCETGYIDLFDLFNSSLTMNCTKEQLIPVIVPFSLVLYTVPIPPLCAALLLHTMYGILTEGILFEPHGRWICSLLCHPSSFNFNLTSCAIAIHNLLTELNVHIFNYEHLYPRSTF